MNTPKLHLGRGERAPDFVLPVRDGTPTRFYARAGGSPTLLLFYATDEEESLTDFSEALNRATPETVSIFAVKRTPPQDQKQTPPEREPPFPVFTDTGEKVRSAYRLDAGENTTLFVLSPNLRVLDSLPLQDAATTARQVASVLDTALPRVEPLEIAIQAPVLLIPDVLDPEICRFLIHVWETRGNVETGVERSRGEQRKDAISHQDKRRRDHIVEDGDLLKRLSSTVGRRVMPEVQKAFAFRATRFEGFKIACYDAETGGYFHAHRDNLSPSTAHRRFALTLNLNADYEGGHLRFPEYGPHLYRPQAGGAIVFASSHLHGVTEVTRGRRFTLLSFLFGEEDVRIAREKAPRAQE